MPEIDYLWPTLQSGEVEGALMPLAMQATMVRNSAKHVQDEVRTPEMVDPILEIYEAACGASLIERPCFSVTNCTIAPLQHDREMTEAGLRLCKRGVPIFVLPMPQVGTTGPGNRALGLHRQHGRTALGHRALPARRSRAAPPSRAWARASPTCARAATSRPAPRSD